MICRSCSFLQDCQNLHGKFSSQANQSYVTNHREITWISSNRDPLLKNFEHNTESMFFLYFIVVKCAVVIVLVAKSCPTLATSWTIVSQAPLFMNFPGKNPEVGCHFLLQEIFTAQGLNRCLLHWQADSLPLSHQRSPLVKYTSYQFYHLSMFKWIVLWH